MTEKITVQDIYDARVRLVWHCHDALVTATEAALRYDASILGHAARGEYDLKKDGSGIADDVDLDALYFDWQTKAATAMEQVRKWSKQ